MKIVFCAEPFTSRVPDPAYAEEVSAASSLGMEFVLIDFEALIHDRDAKAAVRWLKPADHAMPVLYRGWMLRPALYAELYYALQQRGLSLINDPAAYTHTHHFPEAYSLIAPYTPHSISLAVDPTFRVANVIPLLAPFGDRPLIVKDYVKSRKHDWDEACFIPRASDHTSACRVIQRFVDLQGETLNEGLVLREFVELEPLGQHAQSGMPLTQEFRLWFVDGVEIFRSPYWDQGSYTSAAPPAGLFAQVAHTIQSRFFTMDVAQQRNGRWIIVELGDGQVAGLPEAANVAAFYQALLTALAN